MHKILRIIWGILKSKKPHDPGLDEANQERNQRKINDNENKAILTKRRMQEFDQQAPISKIEAKKRKVHHQSQVSNAERLRDQDETPSLQT